MFPRASIPLSLAGFALEQEAEAQGMPIELIVTHAAMLVAAELDS